MPHRRLPNTVASVLRTLKVARDTYKNTPVAADRAISTAQFAQLDDTLTPPTPPSLLSRLIKEASDRDNAQAGQTPLTTELARKTAQSAMFISHFHQVLDLGIARGYFQSGARSYYGRDVSATAIPDLSSQEEVKEAGEKVASGEAARQTAEGMDFVPMVLPGAGEVAGVFADFLAAYNSAQQAHVLTDQQSEELQALYPEALDLAVDICDTVEFFYRKDPDDGSRRAKCARWGVVYIYQDGTPTDPPPAPPEPPTPPTP